MKVLVADKFEETGLAGLRSVGCEVVDEAALLAAVRDRGLRAGLDVFSREPEGGSGVFEDPIMKPTSRPRRSL